MFAAGVLLAIVMFPRIEPKRAHPNDLRFGQAGLFRCGPDVQAEYAVGVLRITPRVDRTLSDEEIGRCIAGVREHTGHHGRLQVQLSRLVPGAPAQVIDRIHVQLLNGGRN